MTRIGVIADDFTGATDVAAAFAKRGYRAAVLIEAPAETDLAADLAAADLADPAVAAADAVVVALKSRTAPVAAAVASSTAAYDRLQALGADRFYVKYCSTFDSTDQGNIGPVLDALVDRTAASHVVVVPSFPDNGRTVEGGRLSVNGELLENSPMRHHPLTPMTKSRLREILAPQTTRTIGEIGLDIVRRGDGDVASALASAPEQYLVVDAVTDDDLGVIARATADAPLVSGGAGLALGAPRGDAPAPAIDAPAGRRLVVCGSASARTREQIAAARDAGLPLLQLELARLAADPDGAVAGALAWFAALPADSIPVVYSVGDLADIDTTGGAAADVESALSAIVRGAIPLGARRVIVAGGETSGAVVRALGIRRLAIGQPIAPGVSWAAADTDVDARTEIALALKSGNFGAPDMFVSAWELLA